MRGYKKKIAVILLMICVCAVMSGCSKMNEEFVKTYVMGNMDAVYLGTFSEEYLETVDATESELKKEYLAGIEAEAEYFSIYWGIVDTNYEETFADLDSDLKGEIIDLFKEIYSYSKYEFVSCDIQRDNNFVVEISVLPIDIMEQAYNACINEENEAYNQFWLTYPDEVVANMSDEEYAAYSKEYGKMIVNVVSDYMDSLGYKEDKTQVIRVEEDEEGLLAINEDDFANFDSNVIYYP